MKKNNKKGFTLIELLAVIVILGVVMAVAIPSMQKVINNSKKDTLVSTALEYISGAKTMLTSEGSLPESALAVPVSEISLDRGGKSPFNSESFNKRSYVIVINTGSTSESTYDYYITLGDDSNNCLVLTSEENLNNKAKTTRTYIKSGTDCTSIPTIGASGSEFTVSVAGASKTMKVY